MSSLGDGPPVVLIHGMAASLRQWDYLMPQLAAQGFSAHALDLQGHGDSPKPNNLENYHIEVLYEQLKCWIDQSQTCRSGFVRGALFRGIPEPDLRHTASRKCACSGVNRSLLQPATTLSHLPFPGKTSKDWHPVFGQPTGLDFRYGLPVG